MVKDRNLASLLISFDNGCAVTLREKSPIFVSPHALKLIILQMAGEQNTFWAFAAQIGKKEPTIRMIIDPRHRDETLRLAEYFIEQILIPYLEKCKKENVLPQIWVPNEATIRSLCIIKDILYGLFRSKSEEEIESLNEDEKSLWEKGQYLSGLSHYIGIFTYHRNNPIQPILISATNFLNAMFAVPMPKHNQEHLGAVLAWIDPGKNPNLTKTINLAYEASTSPVSVHLSPETDKILAPIIDKTRQAYKAKLEAQSKNLRQNPQDEFIFQDGIKKIKCLITPGLRHMLDLLNKAWEIGLLFKSSDLAKVTETEYHFNILQAFRKVQSTYVYKKRAEDSYGASVEMIYQERISDREKKLLVSQDPVHTEAALQTGHAISGQIIGINNWALPSISGGKNTPYVVIQTHQTMLNVREGDEMSVKYSNTRNDVIRSIVVILILNMPNNQGVVVTGRIKGGLQGVRDLIKSKKSDQMIGQILTMFPKIFDEDKSMIEFEYFRKLGFKQAVRNKKAYLKSHKLQPMVFKDGTNRVDHAHHLVSNKSLK